MELVQWAHGFQECPAKCGWLTVSSWYCSLGSGWWHSLWQAPSLLPCLMAMYSACYGGQQERTHTHPCMLLFLFFFPAYGTILRGIRLTLGNGYCSNRRWKTSGESVLNPFYSVTEKAILPNKVTGRTWHFPFQVCFGDRILQPSLASVSLRSQKNYLNPPASTYQVEGLQVCSSTPSLCRARESNPHLHAYQAHMWPTQLHSQLFLESLSGALRSPSHLSTSCMVKTPFMVAVK